MLKAVLNSDTNFTKSGDLFYQNDFHSGEFESAYVDIRNKEGRLFSDSEVLLLPCIAKTHPLADEWRIRKRSTARLTNYLAKQSGSAILEIGCGNGWLAHALSKIPKTMIVGIDVNETELKQASKVFAECSNLAFIFADVFSVRLPFHFDQIVFASSIQYFSTLENLLIRALSFLKPDGEIHIVDTPFYNSKNVEDAKERSRLYFNSQTSKMEQYYFHHSWENLRNFKASLLYNPAAALTRLQNTITSDSPFPWIRIKKADNA